MPAIIAHPGIPLWVDLATIDLAAAEKFYEGLFGWEISRVSDGYAIAKKEGMPVAGLAQVPDDNKSVWGMLLYTPDVSDAHQKAIASGAQSVLEPSRMPDGSQRAIIVDPSGATVGLKNTVDEVALFAAGEPATPVWHELAIGKEWAATLDFYHDLAGWDIRTGQEPDGLRFAVGEFEGSALVGMWDASHLAQSEGAGANTLSAWLMYWGVVDVKEAIARAVDLGAEVAREPWMSEFGFMATVIDPQGAIVNLCEIDEYVPGEDEVHEPDLFAP